MSHPASTIAFLVSKIACVNVAPDHHAAVRPKRNGVRHSIRQLVRFATIRGNGIQYLETRGELPRVAGVQNLLARGHPAIHAAYRPLLVGQAARHVTRRGHDIDLAGTFLAPHKSQQRPIRRKTWITDLAHASRKTFGASPLARNKPQIILRHKHNLILMNSRITDISLRCHSASFQMP